MGKSIANKLDQGLTPDQFVQSLSKNVEQFHEHLNGFVWPSEDDREFFESIYNRDDLRAVILAADWCGDCARNVPVLLKSLEATGMPVEVLVVDDHSETLDQFLTMGGRSIPIAIIADTGGHVLGTWGPRPAYVQEPMVAFKQANPDREAADYQQNLAVTKAEIVRRYGEGTAFHASIVSELRTLLESV